MNITFNLRNPNDDLSRVIMVVYLGEKLPLRYSTGLKIPTKFWNASVQRLRVVREHPHAKSQNDLLDQLKRHCEDYARKHAILTSKELKSFLDEKLNRQKEKKNTLITLLSQYIENNPLKSNISSYRNTLKALKEFEDTDFDKVTYDYLERFKVHYLSSKIERFKYKGKSPSANYFYSHIKNIKSIVNHYRKRGYQTDDSIKDFNKEITETDSIYLSAAEIEAMEKLTLTGTRDKARDLFLTGCYTALRVSDYGCLKKENIRDGKIYKTTKKTGERVVIPLHPKVKAILEKYDYQLPVVSDVLINRYIKSVAKMAGIDKDIQITRQEGFEKISYTKKKWELVSSHTARRSGATNMYLAGISPISIMMITGHRSEKSFLNYIKVTKEQNAELLAQHAFFK